MDSIILTFFLKIIEYLKIKLTLYLKVAINWVEPQEAADIVSSAAFF